MTRQPISLTRRGETVRDILAVIFIMVTLASFAAIGKMLGL